MRIKNYILYLALLLFTSHFVRSQNIDSLKLALKNAKHDTLRCNVLNELIDAENDLKICSEYNAEVIALSEKNLKKLNPKDSSRLFYLQKIANAYNTEGFLANQSGDITKALEYFNKALKIQEDIQDKKGIANSLGNIGSIFRFQGDVSKAIDYFFRSLKLHEESNDKKGVATSWNNIGALYKSQGLPQKALDCFEKCLLIQKEIKDETGIARSLNNMGFIHQLNGDTAKALLFYQMSLKKYEDLNSKQGTANALKNIGFIYQKKGDINKALDCFNRSLKLQEEIKDKLGVSQSYNSIGRAYLELGETNKALENAQKSLKLSQELGFPDIISSGGYLLSKIYAKMGNYKEAYNMHLLYKQMSDSMANEVNRKASVQKSFQYEYDKKAIADSIKVSEERKGFNIQIKQDQKLRTVLYISIGLIALFSVFIYNRFRLTRKQKHIIELQKTEVDRQRELADSRREIAENQKYIIEEKQKEILDSIHYAKRIQQAMLTNQDYISKYFLSSITEKRKGAAEYFILYQPKDIVSGDFYWALAQHNKFYFAVADCTGHGVPGAFMSLLNISFLNENVIERAIEEPHKILNEQRKEIINALNPNGNENSKDGMDCALCAFDFVQSEEDIEKNGGIVGTVDFAAANIPLWLMRDGNLTKYESDKMPVGKYEDNARDFKSQKIDLMKGDVIYMLTDGYTDQFGGENGKKFKYKHLRDALLANYHKPMTEQKEILSTTINDWKGNLEQVDDILIIGIRI